MAWYPWEVPARSKDLLGPVLPRRTESDESCEDGPHACGLDEECCGSTTERKELLKLRTMFYTDYIMNHDIMIVI